MRFAVILLALSWAQTAAAEPAETGYVWLPDGMGTVTAEPSSNVLYLNRCQGGCTLVPGFDDSRSNESSIVRQTSYIPEYPFGDESWERVVRCVETLYGAYGIEVTDQDPGSAPHFEAIVAGEPGDIGYRSGVGGVAPFDCGVVDNAISFTFAAKLGDSPQRICEVIGQESAHAWGLDHELLCQDPMTYLTGCGNKCFRDADATCGEWMERECACGGSTQNSHLHLTEMFGARESQPSILVTTPAAGADVEPGFFVRVEHQVPCLASVEAFLVTGPDSEQSLGTLVSWPYVFNTPADLEEGTALIKVVATDADGAELEEIIEVTVTRPDEDPDTGPCVACPGGETGEPPGGCAASDASGPMALLLSLALLGWVRKKRPSRGT